MGRKARGRRDLPHPKPVEKIQLSGENFGRRAVLALVLLVCGVSALVYTFVNLFAPQKGWQTIAANSSAGPTCADELVFLYDVGGGGQSPSVEGREVTALYSDACRKLFQLFHTMESFEGVVNLREINLHPNETLTVDAALYRALEQVERSGDRTIYLGPVYARYQDLFYCQDDSQLMDFDPWLSEAVRQEYGAAAAYARNPEAVSVSLLGNNQVCLRVSDEYLSYARREGIERFLDFGWLKNAFVVDYLADLLTEKGYTNGSISSYDGFSRNLDSRGLSYALNVYDYVDGTVYQAGVMEYQGPISIVSLRGYAASEADRLRIYELRNGDRRTAYLSPVDGRCRNAVDDLACYSRTAGCGEIALRAAPIYVADRLDVPALEALSGGGIESIRCENRVIYGTDPELALSGLYEKDGVRYTVSVN